MREILRHGTPRGGEDSSEELHCAGARLRIVVLELLHDRGPHGDERGGVDDGYCLEDVGVPAAQRVLSRAPVAQRVDQEVLHRELQVVLGLAHQVARQIVRRRVLPSRGLHHVLEDHPQHLGRHVLRFLQHRAQHLSHVFLHQRAVRRVDALEKALEELGQQSVRAGAGEVQDGNQKTDGGDICGSACAGWNASLPGSAR